MASVIVPSLVLILILGTIFLANSVEGQYLTLANGQRMSKLGKLRRLLSFRRPAEGNLDRETRYAKGRDRYAVAVARPLVSIG